MNFAIEILKDELNELRQFQYSELYRLPVETYDKRFNDLTKAINELEANGVESDNKPALHKHCVSVSLPSDEEIETLANDIIFVSENDLRPIEIYREGFIAGMTQLKDELSSNER